MMAAILAGGRARRLGGRDKLRLLVGGQSILERTVAALRPVAERIVVVTGAEVRFHDPDLPVVPDRLPGRGPLGGIETALVLAGEQPALVVAADLPFLSARFLAHLVSLVSPAIDAVVPRAAGRLQPLCAVYSPTALGPIRQRLERGDLKVVDALPDLRVVEVDALTVARFDPDGRLFFNINTPEDYERARQWAGPDHVG